MSNKQLVEFELEDGTSVIFETPSDDEMGRISHDDTPEKANEKFEKVVSRIKPVTEVVLDALKQLNTPSEIGIEFGVKFSAQAGVIFASADSETSFKVSIKWNNKK